MHEPVRVLVVDDSTFIRRAVGRMLESGDGIEVVGSAVDGTSAVEQAKTLAPDVIVMDVNMPGVDGLEALSRIMTEAPTAVLMLSTLTSEGAETTLKALELGAVDFLDKSSAGTSMDIYALGPQLREKVFLIAGAAVPSAAAPPPERHSAVRAPKHRATRPGDFPVTAIGASTGGPRALNELLCALPGDLPTGIVIAQHMPAGFTRTLAERMNRRSELEVLEGEDLMEVRAGRAIVAPGGRQCRVERGADGFVVRISDAPDTMLHRPSVDLLFNSVAEVVAGRSIGIILTGMGDDGSKGLAAMKAQGARTMAESEETAVIYGMPRAARPWADEVEPLHEIGPALIRIVCGGSREVTR